MTKEEIKLYLIEFAAGMGIAMAFTGTIFTVAAWNGAVVPVKWKPVWSKWFWDKNH